MANVRTAFGAFVINRFEKLGDETGVEIRLTFQADPPFQNTRLGIVQACRSKVGDAVDPVFGDDDDGPPFIKPESEPSGFRIDKRGSRNPLIAVTAPQPDADDLASGVEDDFAGTIRQGSAIMNDMPHLPAGPDRSQELETTCVIVDGPDAGRYLGSVSWGWRKGADGELHFLFEDAEGQGALGLVSSTWVSDTFLAAARKWNRTKAADGRFPVQLNESQAPEAAVAAFAPAAEDPEV